MTHRSYAQDCLIAQALDDIGERWTLLIIRELAIRPCRYGNLQKALPGIGTNLLAERLKHLRRIGLISQQRIGNEHPTYRLTETGQALIPLLLDIIRWQWIRNRRDETTYRQNHWGILGLQAFFRPERAQKLDLRIRFEDSPIVLIHIRDGQLAWLVDESAVPMTADVNVMASIFEFFSAIRAGARIRDGHVGEVQYEGPTQTLVRFAHCFHPPTLS